MHGLNGDAVKTWTAEAETVCWLNHPDLLPKYIKRTRVLSWGYNANISSLMGKTTSSERILQHAQTLIAQLHADRDVSSYILQKQQTGAMSRTSLGLQRICLCLLIAGSFKMQTTDLSSSFVIHLVGL